MFRTQIKVILCGVLMLQLSCERNADQNYILAVGTKSRPGFEELEVGSEQGVAVFGYGDLTEWGKLNVIYSDGDLHTFDSGGVICHSGEETFIRKISGEAKVVLLAYLYQENDHLFGSKERRLIGKWQIETGKFSIDLTPP